MNTKSPVPRLHIITLRLFSKAILMPRLRVSVLIDHLDALLSDLSLLWCETHNYDNLALIELMSQKIEKIIAALKVLEIVK